MTMPAEDWEKRLQDVERTTITLEQICRGLEGGLKRVETSVNQISQSVSSLVEKLDNRYPTKESVDLRFQELHTQIHGENGLLKQVDAGKKDIETLKKFMYKSIGGAAIVTFVAGLIFGSHSSFHLF